MNILMGDMSMSSLEILGTISNHIEGVGSLFNYNSFLYYSCQTLTNIVC